MSEPIRVDGLSICSMSTAIFDHESGEVIDGTEGMSSLELMLPHEYITQFPLGSKVDIVIHLPGGAA
ncbi:hypothetical protein SEA_MORKIE_43 [Gordonia phage Morkie]|nr:hypothetical protein SEA_MORKIE_43 [Gordonia phage Morkie]UYL87800.1 hypothetical protein SEA_ONEDIRECTION_38 [Gordonia phage OneDirection]